MNKYLNIILCYIKYILRIDRAPKYIIIHRIMICNICEYRGKINCIICGCVLHIKTRVASQSCPINKWTSITVKGDLV